MSNLLPQKDRTRRAHMVTARILIVIGLALSGAGIIGILSLAPAFFSVSIPREALEHVAKQSGEESATSTTDRDTVARFKLLIRELGRLAEDRASLARAYELLEELRPAGMNFENVYYRSGTSGTIVVSGTVTKRDLVGTYRAALEKTGHFKDIAVPVAALVGTSAGNFTMTLSGNY